MYCDTDCKNCDKKSKCYYYKIFQSEQAIKNFDFKITSIFKEIENGKIDNLFDLTYAVMDKLSHKETVVMTATHIDNAFHKVMQELKTQNDNLDVIYQ